MMGNASRPLQLAKGNSEEKFHFTVFLLLLFLFRFSRHKSCGVMWVCIFEG